MDGFDQQQARVGCSSQCGDWRCMHHHGDGAQFLGLFYCVKFAIGASAALIIPGISALTLGTTGYKAYARRQGRNEVFNHAGNVVAAVMAGLVGHFLARELIFWVVALWSVFSMLSVYMIRSDDIDLAVARGANRVDGQIQVSSFATLLQDKAAWYSGFGYFAVPLWKRSHAALGGARTHGECARAGGLVVDVCLHYWRTVGDDSCCCVHGQVC